LTVFLTLPHVIPLLARVQVMGSGRPTQSQERKQYVCAIGGCTVCESYPGKTLSAL